MDKEKIKQRTRQFLDTWNDDYAFKTYISSFVAFLIGLCFILYNGIIGVVQRSLWHGSICIYYMSMALIRGLIVNSQRDPKARDYGCRRRKRVILITHILMFFMDFTLIGPIWAMVDGTRVYDWGLIPAISIAAYTCYRITMCIRNYSKAAKTEDSLLRELRTVYLMDALFAVIVLQNTLILVNDGVLSGPMLILSIITSLLISFGIVAFSIISFTKSVDELHA